MSVESVAAELAAMRALTRNLETQLKKLDPETQKRVLAWFAEHAVIVIIDRPSAAVSI